MNVIEVNNLIKKYKKSHVNAVDDISFSVKEGELFAFLGPNGAGKTTTISILTTRLSKTGGDVKIAGFDLEKNSSDIRSNVGIIFQNPSLDVNLTAEENIRFHSILYGLYPFAPTYSLMPQSYKDRVNELVDLIGMKDSLFSPVKTLSGGMKRKLEIIRSIMHAPKVLFLDEPTVGLDPLSRKNIWEYLQHVRETLGITIFLTTHYLDEAEGADHICIINNGKIVADGTPDSIKGTVNSEFALLKATRDSINTLKEEIEKTGYKYTLEEKNIKVFIDSVDDAKNLITNLKTPLEGFSVENISLEDAYLNIIGNKE